MSKFINSKNLKKKPGLIVPYGPPGLGKTTAILSLSEKCPAKLPSDKPVVIDDIAIINYDIDGLLTLTGYNIEVPYIVDLSEPDDKTDTFDATNEALIEIAKLVREGKIKALALDTISSFNNMRILELQKQFRDGRQAWGQLKTENIKLANTLGTLGIPVVALSHSKFNEVDPDSAASKGKAKAEKGTVQSTIEPALVPSIAPIWNPPASLIVGLSKKRVGAKTERFFVTNDQSGFLFKTRFDCFNKEEPADFRALLAKIETFSNNK